MGVYKHNERKTKNHSNKNIDISKTYLNYYLKKNGLSYIKEFDKIKEQFDLKGQIRSNSNILCEMVFTSDKAFFEDIGLDESKRYFTESYNFISYYKKLGEENIISAVVHMDEDVPHMHLLFIQVVHTVDKQGKPIDKVCCRDYWRGKNSYRDLQNAYYKYITEKGFNLERGELVEITNREHYSIQEYKQLTNFENTKKLINNIKIEIPKTPDIKDIKKIMINRDEKIVNKIIKPKDELIQKLYTDNIILHKELSTQSKLIEKAEIYEKEVKKMKNKISSLESIIENFKNTINKFITWVCNKFSQQSEDEMIHQFETETHISFNSAKLASTDNLQIDDLEL